MIEKHCRSIVKAVSWRLTGTLDTIIVSLLISKKLTIAISIGFIELFTKIGLYYLHERVWNKLKFGRTSPKPIDYEI